MRTGILLSTVAMVVLGSTSAFAQAAPAGGGSTTTVAPNTTTGDATARPASAIEIGLRVGYAIPMGDVQEKASFSDTGISGVIPIQLDVGYKITPNILVGAYFSYGIGLLDSDKIKDASLSQLRFGAQFHYYILPTGQFDPWVGAGIGYEIATISPSSGDSSSIKGLEFVNLQAGADYRVNGNLGIGPFLQFGLGQYSSISTGSNSADIEKTAMHEFLTIGVRGIYDIGL